MDIPYAIKKSRKPVFAVVIDGTATKACVLTCEEKKVVYVGAKNFSYADTKVELISL